MTPLTLEVALAVQQELEHRLEEVEKLRRQHVQRAQYEADLARQRYMEVDPRNRSLFSRPGMSSAVLYGFCAARLPWSADLLLG